MIPGPDGVAECHLLFVYGTLRRGFELHHHLARLGARFLDGSQSRRGADRSGTLSGGAPGGPEEGNGFAANSFELRQPARDLRVLDEVEGYIPEAPERSEFVRAAAEVILNNGARRARLDLLVGGAQVHGGFIWIVWKTGRRT